jgi:hypothetical protein
MKTLRRRLPMLVLCLVLFTPACAQNAPPNLSPQAVVAWQATKVIHALDIVRDIAVDASNTTPPLVAHDTMLKIVAWHKTAITVAHDSPSGWAQTIKTSLMSTRTLLTPAEHKQLDIYFSLAVTLLNEVL